MHAVMGLCYGKWPLFIEEMNRDFTMRHSRSRTGSVLFRSTKTTDHREAAGIADKWQREIDLLKRKSKVADKHGNGQHLILERFIEATQSAMSGKFSEAAARSLLEEILKSAGLVPLPTYTVRAWFERWLNDKIASADLSENSKISYKHAVRLFLTHLVSKADTNLGAVTAEDIQEFRGIRIQAGMSAKTIDRDLKVVRAAFRRARDFGLITHDPTGMVELLSKKGKHKTQTVEREIFKTKELDAILAAATGDWFTATLIGRYTGARLGDCVRMCWSNTDLTTGIIRFNDQKTSKNYAVPMHRRLQEHLRSLTSGDDPRKFLCPSLASKETGGCNGLSAQFQKIMKSAGIDTMEVETKSLQRVEGRAARTLARRSFHSLRHTYNSELANADVSQEVRRKLVGHSSDEINDIYTHLDISLFREAINKLK